MQMRARQHGFAIAWRLAHHPALANCATGGEHAHADVGHIVHVAMLNAAAREVSHEALAGFRAAGGQELDQCVLQRRLVPAK